jgi:hypothetical protein
MGIHKLVGVEHRQSVGVVEHNPVPAVVEMQVPEVAFRTE